MAIQKLGELSVGSVVQLNEDGVATSYIIVHQGKPSSTYDDSCDGTWLLRSRSMEQREWSDSDSNLNYATSTIHEWLNSTMLEKYDPQIKDFIKQVKIPYRDGCASGTNRTGSSGLLTQLFLLGACEVGFTTSYSDWVSNDGDKLDYFEYGDTSSANTKRIAKTDDSYGEKRWWLRTPTANGLSSNDTLSVMLISAEGKLDGFHASGAFSIRQAMILPTDLYVYEDGTVFTAPNPPEILNTPSVIMRGQKIPVSWSEVSSANRYVLYRSVDSGEWEQIYSGSEHEFEDIAREWNTVQYRVQGVVEDDYGEFALSDTIPVISSEALAISGTDEDLGAAAEDISYSIASDTGNKISVSCKINGVSILEIEVETGFGGTIPVIDLPTGYGQIVLVATVVTEGGEPITATRTWTYRKPAVAFPAAGGVAQLTQDGRNVFPPTLAECVRVPAVFGGDLGKALELLLPLLGMAAMAVGSYEGTGTFGAESPNSLTFAFAPQLVIVSGGGQSLTLSGDCIEGNAVTWHSGSAESQMNQPGVTYTYAAIGKAGA